jgi:Mn-dependent DtxR family transcriptional regulator
MAIVGQTIRGCTAYYMAVKLRISRPDVSKILRRLKRLGLVTHDGYWRLTAVGRATPPRDGAEAGE